MLRWRSSKTPEPSPWSQTGLNVQLGGLLLAALLHSFFIPPWAGVAMSVLVAWRWIVSHGRLRLPPTWLLLGIAFAGVALIFLYFRTLLGAEAGVAFVLRLAGCKTLETKTPRDAAGLSLLGLFLSFSLLLHKQDLPMTAAVTVLLWLFLWSLAADRLPSILRASGRKTVALLMLQALPLTVILFLVLPRIPGPLWRMPATRPAYETGVSPTMAPGAVTNLIQFEAIAFRVRFLGRQPEPGQLYWRGPVTSIFDGYTWEMRYSAPEETRLPGAPAVRYEITLEPHPYAWIYPLDHALATPSGARRLSDGQMIANAPIRQRQRYLFQASLTDTLPLDASEQEKEHNLRLPAGSNPRSRELGRQIALSHPDPRNRVDALLNRFREQGYRYTLQPPASGRNWIDSFLFQTRLGFCEHFAGSMAFVMRAAGVPARVVGGYLGAEPNPLGDYLIVRQSDAHAWVEVWLENRGWVRIDPTSVVVPARLQGLERALPANEASRVAPMESEWLRRLRYAWDSGQNQWNQWVIGYSEENRLQLLNRISSQPPTRTVIYALLGGLILSGLTLWLWQRLRSGKPKPAPIRQEWLKLERWLERRGVARRAGEGPRDFLSRAREQLSEPLLDEFAARYLRLRYGLPVADDSVAELRRLRRRLIETAKLRRRTKQDQT